MRVSKRVRKEAVLMLQLVNDNDMRPGRMDGQVWFPVWETVARTDAKPTSSSTRRWLSSSRRSLKIPFSSKPPPSSATAGPPRRSGPPDRQEGR